MKIKRQTLFEVSLAENDVRTKLMSEDLSYSVKEVYYLILLEVLTIITEIIKPIY